MNLVDGPYAVHLSEPARGAIQLDYGVKPNKLICQSSRNRLRCVVAPRDQRRAAHVAHSGALRWTAEQVIGTTARRADSPCGKALLKDRTVYLQQHCADLSTARRIRGIKRRRLCWIAWKAVQDDA